MELFATSIIHAIEKQIRRWIPTLTIMRPAPTGVVSPVEVPLNVYSEMGEADAVTGILLDPDDRNCYPYLFLEQLDRHTVGRERQGLSVRHYYNYVIDVRLYIAIDPFNREEIPRINEELRNAELMLERVLTEFEMPGEYIVTEDRRGTIQDGVLFFSFVAPVSEYTIPLEYPKIETVEMGVALSNDKKGSGEE